MDSLPLADDEGCLELVGAGRKFLGSCAGDDDGACRDAAAVDGFFFARDVDDLCRARQGLRSPRVTASSSTRTPSTTTGLREPTKAPSSITTGIAPRRLEDAADAHASSQVNVTPDLGSGADRRPGVHHRPSPYIGSDVHVPRHHDYARLDERSGSG